MDTEIFGCSMKFLFMLIIFMINKTELIKKDLRFLSPLCHLKGRSSTITSPVALRRTFVFMMNTRKCFNERNLNAYK